MSVLVGFGEGGFEAEVRGGLCREGREGGGDGDPDVNGERLMSMASNVFSAFSGMSFVHGIIDPRDGGTENSRRILEIPLPFTARQYNRSTPLKPTTMFVQVWHSPSLSMKHQDTEDAPVKPPWGDWSLAAIRSLTSDLFQPGTQRDGLNTRYSST